ncbi:phosphatase PAP2 family protein [Bifidobacterium sp.]|uniref:phosphatase PAP2 family protein n=1 Tax=Bifidobacterium sp. TaxID=41200 RepID=UPI003D7E020F
MRRTPLLVLRGGIAAAAAAVMALGVTVQAQCAEPYPSDTSQPDYTALLSDFGNYYQPDLTKPATGLYGHVVNADVLRANSDAAVSVNHKANEGRTGNDAPLNAQQQRALKDSDLLFEETYPDALGSTLGEFLSEGIERGDLPLSTTLLVKQPQDGAASGHDRTALLSNYVKSSAVKKKYVHPRPFADRTNGGYVEAGLPKTEDIIRLPEWTDGSGNQHDPGYDSLVSTGSFPSGHTIVAYAGGIGLATLLPQLAPEILTRASEAANNRLIIGVHYPLDLVSGRILGEAGLATRWSDEQFRNDKLMPAYQEMQAYMAKRCVGANIVTRAADDPTTVQNCVTALNANSADSSKPSGGYTNDFTDDFSTQPVTNRTSALAAYQARMSYGFKPTSATGKAAVVPEGAENLLITAFPTLNAEQRRAVLAATEIDSGEPLDASSNGYQRLNLAAAYSAKVTLSADGSVVKVEPGQAVASVVCENGSADSDSSNGSNDAAAGTTKTIANTGSDMLAPASMMVACLMLGIGLMLTRRRA